MKKPPAISYSGSAAELIANARLYLNHLRKDIDAFKAFTGGYISETYADDFEQAIDKARDSETAYDLSSQYQQIVQKVKDTEKEARQLVQALKFFVERAYADEPNQASVFRLDEYRTTYGSAKKLLPFIKYLYETVDQKSAALAAVHYTEAHISELQEIGAILEELIYEQQHFRKQKKIKTQERQKNLKVVWDYVREVCKVGKLVFPDRSSADYKRYVLP